MPSVTELQTVPVAPDIRPARPVAQKSSSPAPAAVLGSGLPTAGKDLPQTSAVQDRNAETHARAADDVRETVHNLNDFIQRQDRAIQFEVDDVTGDTVIKVMDSATDEVIRQIPSEELMALARRMMQLNEDKGNLFQDKV